MKPSGRPDLALIRAAPGTAAAALFTRNRVRAAPIEVSAGHLAASGGLAEALLINAGVANAGTGADGVRRARRVSAAVAGALGVEPSRVLVNSTGVIGPPLPDDRIVGAIPALAGAVSAGGLGAAAEAIMTTDTVPKLAACSLEHAGRSACVVGIAKGSGMIHPDLATMIAVLMTDAAVEPDALDGMLRCVVERSFHRISVDGDTSTNDAVFALASGRAGALPAEAVEGGLGRVARELAEKIVSDGEGAEKLIRVRVVGARVSAEALRVARTVAGSLLVRTAVAGGDPNWGRILAAAGRSGVDLDPGRVSIRAGGRPLVVRGVPVDGAGADREIFAGPRVTIEIDLDRGDAEDEFLTCDLTAEYVRINADYTT